MEKAKIMIQKMKLLALISLLFLTSCGGGGGSDGGSASTPSALCTDGTYSYSQTCAGTCSSHGGVATWYNNCGDTGGTTPTDGNTSVPFLKLDTESWNNAKWG